MNYCCTEWCRLFLFNNSLQQSRIIKVTRFGHALVWVDFILDNYNKKLK